MRQTRRAANRNRCRAWLLAVAASAVHTSGIVAQAASGGVTIAGVAFDSLHGRPLAGAFVTLAGSGQNAATDSAGVFHFADVVPGAHVFTLLHPTLDSIGLTGRSVRAVIGAATDTVRIAIPSFATLWHFACGTTSPPRDSGLVYGTVRSAQTGRVIAGATVSISWIDIEVGEKSVAERPWLGEVESDSAGDYAVCSVPPDATLRAMASTDSASSGLVDLPPSGTRIHRRDLVIGSPASASAPRGVATGSVVDGSGSPIAGARIATAGAAEARTDATGRFVLRGVPLGTRQIEATAIGAAPAAAVVDVTPGDTARATFVMRRVVALAPVTVRATSSAQKRLEEIDDRRRLGVGHFIDSTFIEKQERIQIAMDMTVGYGRTCRIVLDGRITTAAELRFHDPLDIALVEMERDVGVPIQYRPTGPPCWVALVWTKNAIR